MTKDERFLLELYKKAQRLGNLYAPIDPYQLGKEIGFTEKQIKTILKWHLQANFIKKKGEFILLTPQGEELALSYLA